MEIQTLRNLISKLNLPESILELYDGNYKNGDLQNDFKDPYSILSLTEEQQDFYLVNRYLPILAYTFEKILAYDTETKKYVKYSIEYFREENLKPISWDCLFVDIVVQWWELEYPDDKIIGYGKELGIKNIEFILKLINEGIKEEDIIDRIMSDL
ncbi:hypothetical protein [Chryseobacterium sp.]|uniref:hypothetical protein n=1 Tax=Chryseobacterium sp. TaxID=1871047 RepID=UPI0025C012A4|nr:hypothetical protein [Chryseobacterium sp.]